MTKVTAQVVVRSPAGDSVLDASEPITAESAERYRSSAEALDDATRRLADKGFEVGDRGGTGLTVAGDQALFERVFAVELEPSRAEGGASSLQPTGPVLVPDDLADVVAGVVFSIPPIFP